ncbi:MAG: sulfotransferase [Lysobacterales bacterium]
MKRWLTFFDGNTTVEESADKTSARFAAGLSTMTPAAVQVALQSVDDALKTRGFASAMSQMQELQEAVSDDYSIAFAAAQLALRIEQPGWAKKTLEDLSKRTPPTWQAGVAVVDMMRASAMPVEARTLLHSLREDNPDEAVLDARAGDLALAVGNVEDARELYGLAQKADPTISSVYLFFSRDPESDPQTWLDTIRQDKGELTKIQHANLKVAEGRCLDRLDQHAKAFEAFSQARELMRDPRQARALDRQIEMAPGYVASFPSTQMRDMASRAHHSDKPIFLVGMPRTGSLLASQVLSAHPDVHGLGERRILSNLVSARLAAAYAQSSDSENVTTPTTLDALDGSSDTLEKTAVDYLQRALELGSGDALRTVDKMPFNFSLVGAAHVLFPAGHIVHMARTPLDTAWSMFTAAFSLPNLLLNLHDTGRLYALHDYLMAQWKRRCGDDAIIDLSYESLTSDFSTTVDSLLKRLGLNPSDDCANFFASGNEVLTSSDLQVREPVHQRSIGRSEPYVAFLKPFSDAYEKTAAALQEQAPAA